MTSSIFEYTNRSSHGKDNARIKTRQEANKHLSCSCSGCSGTRNSLSIYCYNHRERYRRYGHPTLKVPTKKELRALEGVIQDWLENVHLRKPIEREGFKKLWGSAVVRLRKSPRYAVTFSVLEGCSGYTAKTKACVLLSWYQHKKRKPLGAAMLRYMAVRLWAVIYFKSPQGKYNYIKELDYFVNTWAGKFVLSHSGFSKTKTEQKIIGWERPSFISSLEKENRPRPITERVSKKVRLSPNSAAGIARAIGVELKAAVEYAMGTRWFTDSTLLANAHTALLNPAA